MDTQEPWIETVSGKRVTFLNPQPEQFDIQDIAYSLANQCRFNGHVPFYSVAEHCVYVASKLPRHKMLAGLLHDASEAYLSDIPTPVKNFLPEYKTIETHLQSALNVHFGIDTYDDDVKDQDWQATQNEAYHLLESRGKDWVSALFDPGQHRKPLCMPPALAYKVFMNAFEDLTKSPIIVNAN